jgi:predicted nucleotidyltransferase
MLKEKFTKLENLLLSQIKNFYGQRLISVVVFGSVGRGAQTYNSDIDILIIAEGLPNGRMKRIREFESVEEKIEPFIKSLRQKEGINTYISAIIKSPEEVEKGSPLFLDMVEDARILLDKDHFFWKNSRKT